MTACRISGHTSLHCVRGADEREQFAPVVVGVDQLADGTQPMVNPIMLGVGQVVEAPSFLVDPAALDGCLGSEHSPGSLGPADHEEEPWGTAQALVELVGIEPRAQGDVLGDARFDRQQDRRPDLRRFPGCPQRTDQEVVAEAEPVDEHHWPPLAIPWGVTRSASRWACGRRDLARPRRLRPCRSPPLPRKPVQARRHGGVWAVGSIRGHPRAGAVRVTNPSLR